MTLRSIQFDWPSASMLLLFIPVIVWLFYSLYRWRQDSADAFGDPDVVQKVFVKRSSVLYWIKSVLATFAFAAAVIALMEPKGNERYAGDESRHKLQQTAAGKTVLRKKMHEVVLLVDASASMAIADGEGGKTRLDIAKEISDQVLGSLRGESVSLYTFTSATLREVPRTMDYFFTRLMLREIGINEGETSGTDIKQALETVHEDLLTMPLSSVKTLILLTDGGDTRLYGLTGAKRKEEIDAIIAPSRAIADLFGNIYTVGIGSEKGGTVPGVSYQGKPVISVLERDLLGKLALNGSGSFLAPLDSSPFRTAQELSRIIARRGGFIDASSDAKVRDAGGKEKIYDLLFQIPLAAVLLALFLVIILPDTLSRAEDRSSVPGRPSSGEA